MNKKINQDRLKITVSLKTYPLEAVYGASYVFVDRAYLFLEPASKDRIKINFRLKDKSSVSKLEAIAGEFFNELLNYTLRLNLSKENKKIRQQIVERALFAAVEPQTDYLETSLAYEDQDDPLGIAIPWEEKYGKKSKRKTIKNKKRKTKK